MGNALQGEAMTPNPVKKSSEEETLHRMARAGFQSMFDTPYDRLGKDSIEREHWRQIAKAMVNAVPFPDDLVRLHQMVRINLEKRP